MTSIAELNAKRIWDCAIVGENRAYGWIGRVFHPPVDAWRVLPLGPTLYDGALGVLVFLAGTIREDALRASQLELTAKEIFYQVKMNRKLLTDAGMGTGIGGILWGGLIIQRAMNSRMIGELLSECLGTLEIDLLLAAADTSDVLKGKAGLILALCCLADAKVDGDYCRWIELAWDSLVQAADCCVARNDQGGGFVGSQFGIAHGVSGIALAMLRAARLLDDPQKMETAVGYFRYVNKKHSEWICLSPESRIGTFRHVGPMTWCNGVVGSVMASLQAYNVIGDPSIIDSSVKVLEAIEKWPLSSLDTSCCGNSGRAAMYRLAAATLSSEIFYRVGSSVEAAMMRRYAAEGAFRVGVSRDFANPVLYQGLAGIGNGGLEHGADIYTWDLNCRRYSGTS